MASRELSILVTAKNLASRVLGQVKGDVNGLSGAARTASSNIGRNMALAGGAIAAGLTLQIKSGVDSLVELERVNNLTAAALESTGNVAGQSVEGIRRRAEEMERMSGIDDKVIQNAENLLLTFPTVTDNFEETLEAAVNLNAAMGGGEEGLQGALIQVAKAVSDPVRGMTALRRSGVSFTKAQEDQIKAMVEANDLLGAQGIILESLEEQFGGAAAAANEGIAGDQKAFADAIEDMQMALATGFLPLITRVSDAMSDLVADPAFLAGVESFGETLADGFDQALDIVQSVDWGAVGSAFSTMGTGARLAMDAFLSAPPWLQTAILTGWGLNKLTGGVGGRLLADIVGAGAKQLLQKLGLMNVQAAVVNVNGPTTGGGGAPSTNTGGNRRPGSKGFNVGDLLNWGAKGGLAAAIITTAGSGPVSPEVQQAMEDFKDEQVATTQGVSKAEASIVRELEQARAALPNLEDEFQPAMEEKIARLESQLAALRGDVTAGSKAMGGEFGKSRALGGSWATAEQTRLDSIIAKAAEQSGKLGIQVGQFGAMLPKQDSIVSAAWGTKTSTDSVRSSVDISRDVLGGKLDIIAGKVSSQLEKTPVINNYLSINEWAQKSYSNQLAKGG